MSSKLRIEVGIRLKSARQKRGVSQQQVIDYLQEKMSFKLKRSSISNYETGVSFPPLDVLRTIAIYLDISVDYLLGLDKSPSLARPRSITAQFLIQQDDFIVLPVVMEVRSLKKLNAIIDGTELAEAELGDFLKSYNFYRKEFDTIRANIERISQEELVQFQIHVEDMIKNYQSIRRELWQHFYVAFVNDFYEGKITIKKR